MADPNDKPSPKAPRGSRPGGRVVALTGASSFLGRNLVGVLEEDPGTSRIITIDVKPPDTAGAKTKNFEVDLTAPESEERIAEILSNEDVDVLVHLCFLSSPTHAA